MVYHKYNLRRILFLSHRYIGIGCAAFVLLLAISGIFLNHTETFKLDERYVPSESLLSWYGINTPKAGKSYTANGHLFTDFGGQLYYDGKRVAQVSGTLLGVVATELFYVAAFGSELLLLTEKGELIERLSQTAGIPMPIQKIAVMPGTGFTLVHSAQGDYVADEELLNWRPFEVVNVDWIRPDAVVPAEILERISQSHRGNGLTLERVLLDLHSGRIAGGIGVIVMDVVALLFIVLAAIGVWMWARR